MKRPKYLDDNRYLPRYVDSNKLISDQGSDYENELTMKDHITFLKRRFEENYELEGIFLFELSNNSVILKDIYQFAMK